MFCHLFDCFINEEGLSWDIAFHQSPIFDMDFCPALPNIASSFRLLIEIWKLFLLIYANWFILLVNSILIAFRPPRLPIAIIWWSSQIAWFLYFLYFVLQRIFWFTPLKLSETSEEYYGNNSRDWRRKNIRLWESCIKKGWSILTYSFIRLFR